MIDPRPFILFIRFTPPDGRQTVEETEVSPELAAIALQIRHDGFRFTVELLTTGDVSMCIEDTLSDLGDFDMALAPNGPEVPVALERLLRRYNSTDAQIWRLQFADGQTN